MAAEMAGVKTVGQCEWADYPFSILEKRWPNVPKWRDIHNLSKEDFYEKTGLQSVDIISGGFPCQPFSTAGKRKGREDDRYLWPEMLRIIRELHPSWVVGENVAGLGSMELENICASLEEIGFEVWPILFPAASIGTLHKRDRFAILAHSNCGGLTIRSQNRVQLLQKGQLWFVSGHGVKATISNLREWMCARENKDGIPNPEYVEWLMGYPIKWTDLNV